MLAVAGCSLVERQEERALEAGFDPITTEAQFIDQVVGQDWQSDEIRVTYAADGTLSGEINGVEGKGIWHWDNDLFCSAFIVGDSGGEGCAKLGIRPGELLVIPNGGRGAPFVYTAI